MKKIVKFLNKNLLIISIIAILLIIVFRIKYEGFADTTEYDIVIIAGQSNAVGNGLQYFQPHYKGMTKEQIDEPLYDDPYFQEDKKNIDSPSSSDTLRKRIKSFNKSNQIVVAQDPIEHFPETSIKYNQKPQGFGISFARQYVKEKKKDVMLLGCAMGSTAFNYCGPANGGANKGTGKNFGWQQGSNPQTPCDGDCCSLFKMSKVRIDNLKAIISPNSKVVAILWLQGEQDAPSIGNGSSYKNGVAQMLKDLCSYAVKQFPKSSNPPILLGGLSIRENSVAHMNPIIEEIVRNNSGSNFKFVPSDDSLGKNVPRFAHNLRPNGRGDFGERVHFSRMAQIEYGYRYYYVFNNNSISFT
uniref:Sialate O-acetylesterase domain-containing protein n=1 Tax=viral metagenome TaxID=1070528 RepID=A0A6C0D8G6_9ZZZZ